MTDPFSATAVAGPALKALELAATAVQQKLAEAEQRRAEDIERTVGYLDAARDAVAALELEAQEILSQASVGNLYDPGVVHGLRERLESMLFQDRMRPHLAVAVEGLGGEAKTLRERATGRLQRQKAEKGQSVEALEELVDEIGRYLDELTQDLERVTLETQYLKSGTGPHSAELCALRAEVDRLVAGTSSPEEAREAIDRAIDAARGDPTKDAWLEVVRKTERVTQRLRRAFT